MTSLKRAYKELAAFVGVSAAVPVEVVIKWISGETSYPHTWRALYEALRKTGYEELSEQIEQYLACEFPNHI